MRSSNTLPPPEALYSEIVMLGVVRIGEHRREHGKQSMAQRLDEIVKQAACPRANHAPGWDNVFGPSQFTR
jgi:hypothetical protein